MQGDFQCDLDMDIERKEVINISGLEKVYQLGKQQVKALDGVSLSICRNEYVAIMGPSGSGKSTLMNILGCLDTPSGGKYILNGTDVSRMGDGALAQTRNREIGFVFQSVALIPMMSAYENVEYALRLTRYKGDRAARAMECLKLVGLSQRVNHLPQEMSGGEQQRVAIARALAHRPKVIFADEPTAELDTLTGLQVVKIFKDLTQAEGVTIVMTTHDTGLMEIGDAVYELEDGEVVYGE